MHRHSLTWIIIFAVISAMFIRLPQMAAKQDAVQHTYSALVEVDALARQQFVEPIRDNRLVDGAIRGMMMQLDPYSGYISADELPSFQRRTHGDFIGVGVELGVWDGRPIVIAPIDDGPAAKAGVQPGDIILSIDGEEAAGLSVFDVEERLGGKPGTIVTLRLQRSADPLGALSPVDVSVERGPVTIRTVRGVRRTSNGEWDYLLDPIARIGYIRVGAFYETTIGEFNEALSGLSRLGARALILDLRFNPGGLLQQAVAMADRFLAGGLVVSTVTRRKAVREYFAAADGDEFLHPMAVLINGSSASSSEIVAGALQDWRRATIVGERSFGKGSVQHLVPLTGHGAAVKLTVAYYRLPSERIIHRTNKNVHLDAWGVKPDVAIDISPREKEIVLAGRREADLFMPDASADGPVSIEIDKDRQLTTALSLLRERLLRDFDFDSHAD